MSTSAPRTLADQLRSWSDDQLAALLEARPDLAAPAPHDSGQLAARVVVRASVLRAMDGLDALELGVLQALVQEADPGVLGADPAAVEGALERLRGLALVWGGDDRPLLVVSELLRRPEGPDLAEVPALLDALDPAATAVLERLLETGFDGRWNGGAGPTVGLVASGLLARVDAHHVTLPWSVRLGLEARAGRPLDSPPVVETTARPVELRDRAAAGAAFELVRRTELLLDRWSTHPPTALKQGGLGVRELKAAAALLHVETDVAALVVETAAGAGLLAQGHTDLSGRADRSDAAWLPTDAYDAWLGSGPAQRWTTLARTWLTSPRHVALVGGRVADRPVNALSGDVTRAWIAGLRRDVLDRLADLPEGDALAGAAGVDSLVQQMRWRRPRRPASRLAQVPDLVQEAALVGVTGLDGLSSFGRALVAGEDPTAVLTGLLPDPVDHVLLQADLTAIAPGPLEQELARRLAMVADVESRGGATVYRFAATSVRRAFDAGWSAAEVHEFVASTSRTPVPQSLTYLVDDVSRRFGTLRAGQVESFLRSDDETALTELLHAPGVEALGLRRIAPTVLVSTLPLASLLPRLRDLGQAPVVEAGDGTVRVARPDVLRARTPRRRGQVPDGVRAG
ncbi:MAG: hypothetical protein JWR20_1714, partial [Marmoricola sp.]|nr:hypothetical protein [Marmoricola sp.]